MDWKNDIATPLKSKELRTKTKAELVDQLNTLKAELAQLRVAKVTGGAANKIGKIHTVRKAIARVNTIYNEMLRKDVRTLQKERKFATPLDIRPNVTKAVRQRLSVAQAAAMTERQIKKAKHFPRRNFTLKA